VEGCSPDFLTIDLSDRFALAGSDRESPFCWQNGGENDAVRACVKKSGLHPVWNARLCNADIPSVPGRLRPMGIICLCASVLRRSLAGGLSARENFPLRQSPGGQGPAGKSRAFRMSAPIPEFNDAKLPANPITRLVGQVSETALEARSRPWHGRVTGCCAPRLIRHDCGNPSRLRMPIAPNASRTCRRSSTRSRLCPKELPLLERV